MFMHTEYLLLRAALTILVIQHSDRKLHIETDVLTKNAIFHSYAKFAIDLYCDYILNTPKKTWKKLLNWQSYIDFIINICN